MDKPSQYIAKAETLYLYFRRDANVESQRLYREAIKLDPQRAQPYAELAYSQMTAWLYNWDKDMKNLDDAMANAQQAVKIDSNDYYNHWIVADVHLYRREFDDASRIYNDVRAKAATQAIDEEIRAVHVDWADMLLLTGDPGAAITEAETAISQSAVPERWFYWVLGWAYYVNGDFQKSLDAMSRLGNPRNAMRKNLVANFVALNQVSTAQYHAHTFLEEERLQGITYASPGQLVWPGLEQIENRLPFKDTKQLDLWKDRLKQAFGNLVEP